MRRFALFGAIALLGLIATDSASAQTSVSIGINQPSVYGRVDAGNHPSPAVVHSWPVLVARAPMHVAWPKVALRKAA